MLHETYVTGDTTAENKTVCPRVLVLLAARNGAVWIQEQIDSILQQTDVDVRIVVSDDCSIDHTRSCVQKFSSTGSVRLISPTLATGSAARNFFFLVESNGDVAEFDLVAFADQDDIWLPDKLARASRVMAAYGADGYSSAVLAQWGNGRTRALVQSRCTTRGDFLFEGAGQGCTFVLSRAFYQRLRAFYGAHTDLTCSIHYHDWATYALARVWQLRWALDPCPTVRYRQHPQNDTGARYSAAGIGMRIQRILNGWYRNQIRAVTRLCLAAAPHDPFMLEWMKLQSSPPSLVRSLKIASFCMRNGRRKALDNIVLVSAAFAGLI